MDSNACPKVSWLIIPGNAAHETCSYTDNANHTTGVLCGTGQILQFSNVGGLHAVIVHVFQITSFSHGAYNIHRHDFSPFLKQIWCLFLVNDQPMHGWRWCIFKWTSISQGLTTREFQSEGMRTWHSMHVEAHVHRWAHVYISPTRSYDWSRSVQRDCWTYF